jgi:hypothetical protein
MTSKHLLNVSDDEWSTAHRYFADPVNKDQIKFRRPRQGEFGYGYLKHSFLKVDGIIYAIDNKDSKIPGGKYLGEGSFGKVSVVQTHEGDNFALKVEVPVKHEYRERELAIMQLMGRLIGTTSRKSDSPIRFKDTERVKIYKKIYTVQKFIPGLDLTDLNKVVKLTHTQLLIIFAKACEEIHNMHRLNILHNDIKPRNFIATVDGLDIRVKVVDFGAAYILPPGQSEIIDVPPVGTRSYSAPETFPRAKYSAASDIYSLGQLMRFFFIPDFPFGMENTSLFWLIQDMLLPDPRARPSLASIRLQLNLLLKQQKDYIEPKEQRAENAKIRYEATLEASAKAAKALVDYTKSNFMKKGLSFLCGQGETVLKMQCAQIKADLAAIEQELAIHKQLTQSGDEILGLKAEMAKNPALSKASPNMHFAATSHPTPSSNAIGPERVNDRLLVRAR